MLKLQIYAHKNKGINLKLLLKLTCDMSSKKANVPLEYHSTTEMKPHHDSANSFLLACGPLDHQHTAQRSEQPFCEDEIYNTVR
jgi:hypothetical protein